MLTVQNVKEITLNPVSSLDILVEGIENFLSGDYYHSKAYCRILDYKNACLDVVVYRYTSGYSNGLRLVNLESTDYIIIENLKGEKLRWLEV
jgi:hypothetical protein